MATMQTSSTGQRRPLAGRKIAVFVEHKYIPEEIEAYRTEFAALGAEVHLVSRLWYGDKPPPEETKAPFYSDVDPLEPNPTQPPKQLEVSDRITGSDGSTIYLDVSAISPSDYDAVVMSANYTSVRLRWADTPSMASDARTYVQSSPVVRFFAEAMDNPRVIKGFLCHALWILTPNPRLLAGRRVTCHTVVMADILNCGAEPVFITSDGKRRPAEVVVDSDIVTGFSKHEVHDFITAIADRIIAVSHKPPNQSSPVAAEHRLAGTSEPIRTGKVLVLVSEKGFWYEEFIKPIDRLRAAGLTPVFVTPTGALPFPDGASLDPVYVDPPLGRPVTDRALAERGKKENWEEVFRDRFSLRDQFPLRPYLSAPQYLPALESYYERRAAAWRWLDQFDALLMVGGSGPLADMVNNGRVHDLVLGFYYADKPIAAECYAVTCLAFARELDARRCIIEGRHVTGHTMEYDYTDGWSLFVTVNGGSGYFNFGGPPFPLEYILRDAVGPNGRFHGNVGRSLSVVLDYPFITSRSVAESDLCGRVLVEALRGLRRYGTDTPQDGVLSA